MYTLVVDLASTPDRYLKTLFPEASTCPLGDTESRMTLQLEDMAAVYGFLLRMRDTGLTVRHLIIKAIDTGSTR
ncbi:MAG: hypothetical protein EA374_07030 [Acholeplasmatales bacterium]|nr:MAG: hypothetical protein EA374_07030 [Acholeplasmatales bacterium]